MLGIAVFGLHGVPFSVQADRAWIEIDGGRGKDEERAFVSDFFAENSVIERVPPSVAAQIGDCFENFVRKDVVGGIEPTARWEVPGATERPSTF